MPSMPVLLRGANAISSCTIPQARQQVQHRVQLNISHNPATPCNLKSSSSSSTGRWHHGTAASRAVGPSGRGSNSSSRGRGGRGRGDGHLNKRRGRWGGKQQQQQQQQHLHQQDGQPAVSAQSRQQGLMDAAQYTATSAAAGGDVGGAGTKAKYSNSSDPGLDDGWYSDDDDMANDENDDEDDDADHDADDDLDSGDSMTDGLLVFTEADVAKPHAAAAAPGSSSSSTATNEDAELQSLLAHMGVTDTGDLDDDYLNMPVDDLDLDLDVDLVDLGSTTDDDEPGPEITPDQDQQGSVDQDHQQQQQPSDTTAAAAAAAAGDQAGSSTILTEQQWIQQQLAQIVEDPEDYGFYQDAYVLDGDRPGGTTLGWWTPEAVRRKLKQMQGEQQQQQQQQGEQRQQQQQQGEQQQQRQQQPQRKTKPKRKSQQKQHQQHRRQQQQVPKGSVYDDTGGQVEDVSNIDNDSDSDSDDDPDNWEGYTPDEMKEVLTEWAGDFIKELREAGYDMNGDIFDLLRTTATGIVKDTAASSGDGGNPAAAAAAGGGEGAPVFPAGPAAIFNVGPHTRIVEQVSSSSRGVDNSSSSSRGDSSSRRGFRGPEQIRRQQELARQHQQQRQQRPEWQQRGFEWQEQQQQLAAEEVRRLDREVWRPGTTLPEMLQQTGMSDWLTEAIQGVNINKQSWGEKVRPAMVPHAEGEHHSVVEPDRYGEQDNVRYEENNVILLQEALQAVLKQQQQQQLGTAGGSRITQLLIAATNLEQLSLLLQRLLPPRKKGPPAIAPTYAEWRRQQQQQQQQQQASSAAAKRRPQLSASDLVVAALQWSKLLLLLPPDARNYWLLHPAQIQLVEHCYYRAAAAAAAGSPAAAPQDKQPQKQSRRMQDQYTTAANSSSSSSSGGVGGGEFFSSSEAAALIHALVSSDSPIPLPLLVLLLQQLTGSSTAASSSSRSVLSSISPCLVAGVIWALGTLNVTQHTFHMEDTAALMSNLTVQFLDCFAQTPYRLHVWPPAAMAAAAVGLNDITDNPPGLLLFHVSNRLLTDNLLAQAPTCSLVLLAAAAGSWAAAAGNGGPAVAGFCYDNADYSRINLLRNTSAYTSAEYGRYVMPHVITDAVVPPDLLDGIARELEMRMSLQLGECQAMLLDIIQERAGAAAGSSPAATAADGRLSDGITSVTAQQLRSQLQSAERDLVEALQQMEQAGAEAADKFEQALLEAEQVATAAGSSSDGSSNTPDEILEAWAVAAAQYEQQQQQMESHLEMIRTMLGQQPKDPAMAAAAAAAADSDDSSSGRVFAGIPEKFSCQAAELCVSANDAALVMWALGMAGYQVDSYLQTCLHLFGDNWPSLLSPTRTIQLLQGLAAVRTAPDELTIKILEMFEERGVSIWVPWHMTPPRLLGLTGSVAQLELTPGEPTVYSWLKAATSMMELYDPDQLAAQCYIFTQLGFTHSTFLTNAAHLAPDFAPLCSPRGLADLAMGFSTYRLEVHELYPVLLETAVMKLQLFNEYELVRLLHGLSRRQGLDLTPLLAAAQVGDCVTEVSQNRIAGRHGTVSGAVAVHCMALGAAVPAVVMSPARGSDPSSAQACQCSGLLLGGFAAFCFRLSYIAGRVLCSSRRLVWLYCSTTVKLFFIVHQLQAMLLQQQQQQQQGYPSSSSSSSHNSYVPVAAPGHLAAIKLLQVLPLCSSSSSGDGSNKQEAANSSSSSCWRGLVSALVPQLVGIPLLLPVEELYGLIQGLASVPDLVLLPDSTSSDCNHGEQQQQQQQQQFVTDLLTAVLVRSTEMSTAALLDTLDGMMSMLGYHQKAAAAAKVDADTDNECQQQPMLSALQQALHTHIEAGGMLHQVSGTVQLHELQRYADYPAKALRLVTAMLAVQQQQQQQQQQQAAAAAWAVPSAAVLQACLTAAQELLPHMSAVAVAELLIQTARLKALLQAIQSSSEAAVAAVAATAKVLEVQSNADLALLLDLSVRELSAADKYKAIQHQSGLLDEVLAACRLLGLPEQTINRLGGH